MIDLLQRAATHLTRRITRRPPDFIVGGGKDPYLYRWFVIPRNRLFNIYLHRFLRDDDDRALHDHSWFWCSILLHGSYIEHTIARGGVHHRQLRHALSIKFSSPWRPHRIELLRQIVDNGDPIVRTTDPTADCWTLFITGPRMRSWGFHCPERGWVHWREFTDPRDSGQVGSGCGA